MDSPDSSTSTHVSMFLCDKHSPMSNLREAMTMKRDER